MLDQFARLVESLFPAINPADAKSCIEAIRQHGPVSREFYAGTLPPKPCQGDIVEPLTFIVPEDDGTFAERVGPGMILSNSCDFDEDAQLVVAECRPFQPYQAHRSSAAIKNNTFFSLMYLADVPARGDLIVALSQLQSVRQVFLKTGLDNGHITRLMSFTRLGYYFLIAKLTVHLLRPQAPDEIRHEARAPNVVERVGESITRLGGRFTSG